MAWDDDIALEILAEFADINAAEERYEQAVAFVRMKNAERRRIGFNRCKPGPAKRTDRRQTLLSKDERSKIMREWWGAQSQADKNRMQKNLFRGCPWATLPEGLRLSMTRALQNGRKTWWDGLTEEERRARKEQATAVLRMSNNNASVAATRARWAAVPREERIRRMTMLQSKRRFEIPWDDLPLGVVPDDELAMSLDVTRKRVAHARQRRGIVGPGPGKRLWHGKYNVAVSSRQKSVEALHAP